MSKEKTIDGKKVLARMRQLQHTKHHFSLYHLTYNYATRELKGLRVVEKAKLRPLMPKERFKTPSEMYVPYIDIELDEPRACFKNLIRFVAFPPDYELQKVTWTI